MKHHQFLLNMKQTVFFLLLFVGISSTDAQNVGINTETPMATLDVNGDVIFRVADLIPEELTTIVLDVNSSKSSVYRITGPANDFNINGISAAIDGRLITLLNRSGYAMTFISQDPVVDPTERIITGTIDNIILADQGVISLQYDIYDEKWIVKSTNKSGGGDGVWDAMGDNAIFDDGFVGIGTDAPVSPLTMFADTNGVGMTQIGGPDSITMTTAINDYSASIGTTTDHIFSLKSGGSGNLHVMPGGNIVIGSENALQGQISSLQGSATRMLDPFTSKITVLTEFNTDGFLHQASQEGQDDIVYQERIGGVSVGIGTFSNHHLRLQTNQVGRLQVLNDGRIIAGDNFAPALAHFSIHAPVNQPGLAVQTSNNTDGIVQYGGEGQKLAMRIGGSSGSIGTWTPHIMRIVSNGVARINIDIFGNVAIGTPDPLPGYMLSVNGHVKCKELVVETAGWPDYVFGDNHKLLPLGEVERFIQQHKHLPNIPAAAELEQEGLPVGEMQKKMMEKIEELTLYVIELKKEIEEIKLNRK